MTGHGRFRSVSVNAMVGTLRFAHPTALRAGVFGYVNRGGDPGVIDAAVRTVAQGRKYVTPEIG